MVLVAIAMVAIIAMAALSIDVITLYLAREEAQRSADAAALAAAQSALRFRHYRHRESRGRPCLLGENMRRRRGGHANGPSSGDPKFGRKQRRHFDGHLCGRRQFEHRLLTLPAAFGVNPMVTVQVTRASMPTFFSRIWGNTGNSVSATATAEAFNPSYSGTYSNSGGPPTSITPVEPRCVKPWVVPNHDPLNPGPSGPNYCDETGGPGACHPFVSTANGSITNPGISLNGGGANGIHRRNTLAGSRLPAQCSGQLPASRWQRPAKG